jgi:outer membrane beta-barrel protein
VIASAGFPSSAQAQRTGSDDGAGSLQLTGYIGLLTPLSRLADQGDTLSLEFSTKASFAAEIDYWFSGSFGLSVVGGYSRPDLTVQAIITDAPPGTLPTPIKVGRADYWAGTANLMWRPILGGSATVLTPYFAVGAGVSRLSYPSGGFIELSGETRFVGTVAGGAHVEMSGPVYLRLDVRDYVSTFDTEPIRESKLQNDLTVSIGIGVELN